MFAMSGQHKFHRGQAVHYTPDGTGDIINATVDELQKGGKYRIIYEQEYHGSNGQHGVKEEELRMNTDAAQGRPGGGATGCGQSTIRPFSGPGHTAASMKKTRSQQRAAANAAKPKDLEERRKLFSDMAEARLNEKKTQEDRLPNYSSKREQPDHPPHTTSSAAAAPLAASGAEAAAAAEHQPLDEIQRHELWQHLSEVDHQKFKHLLQKSREVVLKEADEDEETKITVEDLSHGLQRDILSLAQDLRGRCENITDVDEHSSDEDSSDEDSSIDEKVRIKLVFRNEPRSTVGWKRPTVGGKAPRPPVGWKAPRPPVGDEEDTSDSDEEAAGASGQAVLGTTVKAPVEDSEEPVCSPRMRSWNAAAEQIAPEYRGEIQTKTVKVHADPVLRLEQTVKLHKKTREIQVVDQTTAKKDKLIAALQENSVIDTEGLPATLYPDVRLTQVFKMFDPKEGDGKDNCLPERGNYPGPDTDGKWRYYCIDCACWVLRQPSDHSKECLGDAALLDCHVQLKIQILPNQTEPTPDQMEGLKFRYKSSSDEVSESDMELVKKVLVGWSAEAHRNWGCLQIEIPKVNCSYHFDDGAKTIVYPLPPRRRAYWGRIRNERYGMKFEQPDPQTPNETAAAGNFSRALKRRRTDSGEGEEW
eukprot:COSAG02_NODE_6347_length_3633_cov_1.777023_3_plen_645_part_00